MTDNPKEDVPRLKSLEHTNHEAVVENGERPQREPVFYTIPRDEWAITESAHDAREQIEEMISSNFGTTLRATVSTRKNGSKQINVHLLSGERGDKIDNNPPDKETVRTILPGKIDGVAGRGGTDPVTVEDIPVVIKEMEIKFRNYYDMSYRPVPAGVKWRGQETVNGDYFHEDYCTTCTPAYDDVADEERIVTAQHCFDEFNTDKFRQPAAEESGERVRGKFEDGDGMDAAVVEPYTFDTKYDLGNEEDDDGDYRGYPINGIKSKDWIKDQEGTDTKLTFQGAYTGTQLGKVVDTGNKVFGTDHSLGGGDSGGPAHRPVTGSSWQYTNIAGLLSYVDTSTGTGYFVYLEDVESEINVTV